MADPTDIAKALVELKGAAAEVANAIHELEQAGGADPKAASEYAEDATSSLGRARAALGYPPKP